MASLVKAVDQEMEKNKDLASFVVFLADDADALEPKLKELAEKHKITKVPLTIAESAAGPPKYNIAKDADVTVLLWVGQTVKANHSFAAGELTKGSVKKIVGDLPKILDSGS